VVILNTGLCYSCFLLYTYKARSSR